MNLSGYTLYTSDLTQANTRGTCIYVKNDLKSETVNISGHNFKDFNTVRITGSNNFNILIQCIYRSGTPNTAAALDSELFKLIRETNNTPNYSQKIILGDFNLNKIKWTPEPSVLPSTSDASAEVRFIECIRDSYLTQHITRPTRYRGGNTPTCDDLVFTTNETNVSDITYDPSIGASDHLAIRFIISTDVKSVLTNRVVKMYDKTNWLKMREIFNTDWHHNLKELSAQEGMDKFEEVYNKAVKECVPTKTISSGDRVKPIWMSSTALRKVRRKHASWIRYINTKQSNDYREYIKKRNEASHEIRKSRREYEKIIAKHCRKNPKGVWKYMKSCNQMRSRIPNLKKSDNTLTTTDKEIADTLSTQYHSAFTIEDLNNMPQIPAKEIITEKLKTFTIQQVEVERILKNLHPTKAPGIDGLHPRILKEMAEVIAEPLTEIANISINTGELPSNWKDAIITPIFKKGDKSEPGNYRPVSLTSIFCKVIERIIITQIIEHIKENGHVCKEQHGFTTGRSVTTNILEALNIWTEALMHQIPIDILYLDYRKAFDTVPHQRLLMQLRSFGIDGDAIRWIEGFLKDRRQKVLVNGSESEWANVLSGIPQGSILGPVMFTLFVNDLPNEVNSIISMFADDTKLYAPLITTETGEMMMTDLSKLEDWAARMQMKFHPAKCKVMHLGNNNLHKTYRMKKEDGNMHILETTDVEKDLGVYIDSKLTFTHHVQQKVNTANKILGYIKHTFRNMDMDTFLMLYKSLVRPHLEFASCTWSPHQRFNCDSIERVQRRATRILPQLRHLSYTERLQQLNLETLEYRRKRADLIETYRIITNQHTLDTNCHCTHCPDKHMFKPTLSTTTRGHSKKIQSQEATGVRSHFFAARVIKTWNGLRENTVSSNTVNSFKSNLKKDIGHSMYQYTFSY